MRKPPWPRLIEETRDHRFKPARHWPGAEIFVRKEPYFAEIQRRARYLDLTNRKRWRTLSRRIPISNNQTALGVINDFIDKKGVGDQPPAGKTCPADMSKFMARQRPAPVYILRVGVLDHGIRDRRRSRREALRVRTGEVVCVRRRYEFP